MEAGTALAGRFVLEKVLGSGGMGEVWQGTDQRLKRPVAVKVMRDRLADPRRFQREAQIAARLQHPGITVVYDSGTHDGLPFMVMELLHGQNLADLLERTPGRRLPSDMAVSLIVQAARALQAAHAGHVIHRDLKPANLFLHNGQVKICDFGIARIADAQDGLTTAGYVLGSAQYMSPEQCEGAQIDERSDLYSLGCVLYELLTGQPPFSAGGQRAIMNQHLTKPPPGPRTLRPDIPAALESIVLDMLAKDPDGRPAGAGVVAARLEAVLAAPSPPAVSPQALAVRPASEPAAARLPGLIPVPPRPTVLASPAPSAPPPPQLQVAPSAGSWSMLALDPSGQWLASADGDGTITLWDVASGLPVRSWSAEAHVLAMTAGPGNQLAVGGDDGCARIWDVARATLTGQLRGHAGGVEAVALDQHGIRLATGDAGGGVRLWHPGSTEPVTEQRLAHHCAVTALAFGPSGGRLAAGGDDNTLRVWDVRAPASAMLLAEPPYGEEATAIAFDATGGQLAVGSAEGHVRLWDLGSHEPRSRPAHHHHNGGVLALAWDGPAGHWVSIGADGRLSAGEGENRPVVERGHVRAAAVSVGSGRGAVIDDGSGRIYTFRIGDPGARQRLRGSDTMVSGVAFGLSGELLVADGTDGILHRWDSRRQTLRSADVPGDGISAVAGAPNGRRVAVCAEDGRVTVCDVDGVLDLTEAWAHQCPEPASAVAFSPDGSQVATAGDAVRAWQAKDGSACPALPEGAQRTRAIAYDHTGRHLAAAGASGVVLVWDAAAAVLRHTLVGHKGVVHAAAFSPLSGRLATAGSDGTIRIWDPDRGQLLASFNGWECRARALAFSPADGTLAIGGTDGVVRFREPRGWAQTGARPGHVHGITAMCFDTGGRRLATAGRDGTARVWDLATGAAELVLLPRRGRWAAVLADGTVREHGDAAGLIWYAFGLSRQPLARGRNYSAT